MFNLNTVDRICCTIKHQLFHGCLDFSDRTPKELPAWLVLSLLMLADELSVAVDEIDALILSFLDVSSDIVVSSSDLRSLALLLGLSPRASWISCQCGLTDSLCHFLYG